MTREFERDSKIPMAAVVVGLVVSCFATWYAIHCVWEMFSPAGFDWCGHEASAVFRAARGTIVLSTMLSASIAILNRLARSKDASTLGYLTAYTKLALVVFMAMRMSAVVGFSFGTFVPKSCAPLPFIGGWRCFQIAHIVAMLTLIPVGLYFMELARLSTFASKTPADAGVLLVGLHYIVVFAASAASPEIFGGGWAGNVSPSRSSRIARSGFGST